MTEPEVPNEPPVVELQSSETRGTTPFEVTFTATASDPDGDDLSYTWLFGDGTGAEGGVMQTHTFTAGAAFTVTVIVEDGRGGTARDSVEIITTTPEFNREQTERLLGTWVFVTTIGDTIFTDDYILSDVQEDSIEPGEYNIFGTYELGDLVVAGYSPSLGEFSLFDPGFTIDNFFVFDLTSDVEAEGCYYLID